MSDIQHANQEKQEARSVWENGLQLQRLLAALNALRVNYNDDVLKRCKDLLDLLSRHVFAPHDLFQVMLPAEVLAQPPNQSDGLVLDSVVFTTALEVVADTLPGWDRQWQTQ